MINLFYDYKMINNSANMADSYSKSPIKPKLVVEQLFKGKYASDITLRDVKPVTKEDIELAHTKKYVDAFFKGEKPLATTNQIPWSPELAESVTYTSGALYSAIEFAIQNENSFSFAPVSGFHHATPSSGNGFCTFSGQVIASVKAYKNFKVSGAYCDLDAHLGLSIEDSKAFQPLTSKAITFNINPRGQNKTYYADFNKQLNLVGRSVMENKTHYIIFCHGADSHEEDDLVGSDRVDTKYWLKCSELFYTSVKKWRQMGYNVPVISTLFGGYRADNYEFVIWLHQQDIEMGNKILGNKK